MPDKIPIPTESGKRYFILSSPRYFEKAKDSKIEKPKPNVSLQIEKYSKSEHKTAETITALVLESRVANDAIKAQTTTHQRNGSIFEKSNSSKNGKNESIPTIIK